jgi:hypothetical protein
MSQLSRVTGVATNIRTEDGVTIIRYHSTDVVKFTEHSITLNSGGWHTATTKTRMNQASNQFGLGYSVVQRDFGWYVVFPSGMKLPFSDGMTFLKHKPV